MAANLAYQDGLTHRLRLLPRTYEKTHRPPLDAYVDDALTNVRSLVDEWSSPLIHASASQ